MKKLLFGIMFIICLSSIFAAGNNDEILTSKDAKLNLIITSDISILKLNSRSFINELEVQASYYPKESQNQVVTNLQTSPSTYTIENDKFIFNWNNPNANKYVYEINSNIDTSGEIIKVKKRIPFPSTNTNELEFAKETANIDSNNKDIQKLASELTQGKDDYYDVVVTLADWVNENIEYNLSTVTAEVSQPASWVLEHREGVCDEMTSLFIALLRAVDIPARYVSGISYTNSELFDYDFGPHGWAEVYFPDYGWIPFDATYGEYGYVDASHIVLKRSDDSKVTSSYYSWTGNAVDVEATPLQFETNIIDIGPQMEQNVKVTLEPSKKYVGFNSYNLIKATITNNNNYYYPTRLEIANTDSMETLTKNNKVILLKPGETKTFFWKVKISEGLDPFYEYTFPVSIYSAYEQMDKVYFKVGTDYQNIKLKEIELLENQMIRESEFENMDYLSFYCEKNKEVFYEDENPEIICTIDNNDGKDLTNLNICILDQCTKTDVSKDQSKEIIINPDNLDFGEREYLVTLNNNDISKSDYVQINYLQYPTIDIENFETELEVDFEDEQEIMLKFSPDNNPSNVTVNIGVNKLIQTWNFQEINNKKEIVLKYNTKQLLPKNNVIKADITFYDNNNNQYNVEKELNIKFSEITFWEKLLLYLNYLYQLGE